MIQAKCIQKFRDKNNHIYGYRLQDINGQTQDALPIELKRAIANKQINVVNLTLTTDNRLVDKTEEQLQSIDLGYKPVINKTILENLYETHESILDDIGYSGFAEDKCRYDYIEKLLKNIMVTFYKKIGINNKLELTSRSDYPSYNCLQCKQKFYYNGTKVFLELVYDDVAADIDDNYIQIYLIDIDSYNSIYCSNIYINNKEISKQLSSIFNDLAKNIRLYKNK